MTEFIEKFCPDQNFGCLTYAQNFEDLMVLNLFDLIGIDNPTYLDCGASHPVNISNTYMLYKRGSRGISVEANPNLIRAFHEYRAEDANLNVGVGLEAGENYFYMIDEYSGRNTFCKETAETFVKEYPQFSITEVRKIPVVTLDSIFEKFFVPDFLSIDIEGRDFAVLEQTTFLGNKPAVICVETKKHQTHQMRSMLAQKNYHLYCRMGENLIFVHNNYVTHVY